MEKINARKLSLIFIFVLILLVLALLVGKFSYSYLGQRIGEDLEGQGEVTASGDTLIFSKGNNLSLSATSDNFTTGGSNLSSTTNPKVKLVASSRTNEANATYYVGVFIKNNSYTYSTSDNTPEVILTIKDENGNNVTSGVAGLSYVTSGGVSGFDVTKANGIYNVKTDYPISTTSSTTGTTHTWTFTLTFVNLSTDQSVNENAKMNIDVYIQKEEYKITLADYVISQYTGTQGENNIYYHDLTLANGAGDNNYRYAGPSDQVNNFVCFGSTTSPCPTDNLYRIIGVFGENYHGVSGQQLVKLIKYDYANSNLLGTDGDYSELSTPDSTYLGSLSSINTYYWNNATATNTWSESNLNKMNLNTNFINNIGTNWANKIATTTWKVGGFGYQLIGNGSSSGVINVDPFIPSVTFQKEIGSSSSTTTENVKIGLIYVSDYFYSASPSAWELFGYNSDATKDYRVAISVNWMYMGLHEWTITRSLTSAGTSFFIQGVGAVPNFNVNNSYAIRPSFNLESSVTYKSGSGSMNNPIILN